MFAFKIKVETTIMEANKMKIPVFAGNTVSEFVKSAKLVRSCESGDGSKLSVYGIEVDSPGVCRRAECGGAGKLRCNGSYPRQVIEGLIMVLVLIYRFRCGLCGKTVSRPYSFLVPYRRFTARLICEGIEMYGEKEREEATYDEISTELSVFEPEKSNEAKVEAAPVKKVTDGKAGFCPARSTTFSWVDFVCKRIKKVVQQVEKELVLQNVDLKRLPVESQFRNKNAWKAGKARYKHQREKPEQLNRLSYGLALAQLLVGDGQEPMKKLRAYFLRSAEKCADLLSDVSLVLSITHTSEQSIW